MRKCICKGVNGECHFCSGTGYLAEEADNPVGIELRGAVVPTRKRGRGSSIPKTLVWRSPQAFGKKGTFKK